MTAYKKIKAMNWSSLRQIDVSPMAFRWAMMSPRKDMPYLSLGRLVHLAILEPQLFDQKCVVSPWDSWRTKTSREWREIQIEEGKEVITTENEQTVNTIVENFLTHSSSHILDNTKKENPITWRDQGVSCKARVDAFSRDRLIEIKTTHNMASFVRFDFFKHLYHGQIAWYLDGLITAELCSEQTDVYVICCETKAPYDVAIFEVGADIITFGRQLKTRLLDTWIACNEANLWPGRYPSITPLETPNWYHDKSMDEDGVFEAE